jgi:formylglycine-generating enzyme required for sulfatase activity/predicted DNA-binding WGR domain protein
MRRFKFSDSTSNKFWEVDVKGKTLNITFGKIGTKGQSKPKDFASPEKAKAEMEKLIKEKIGKGYVEVGGKAVKEAKPAAKSAASKRTNLGSMSEGLSKAEKKTKAKKVLEMFAGGQWKFARGKLKAAQEEHWLFEELLEGCKIEDGLPIPSVKIMDIFDEEETSSEVDSDNYDGYIYYFIEKRPVISELSMLEVLLNLPTDLEELQKLRHGLRIQIRPNVLAKYWKEVAEGNFEEGVMYGDPGNFTDQWYEARQAEIRKVEQECKTRSKALNKAWREEEDLGHGVNLEMVLIPAGTFIMGSPELEEDRSDDEVQHEVNLTKSFYMGKYEVTQEQWEAVMGSNPSDEKGSNLPVTNLSWIDCQEFIKKLNDKTKGGYRLPTEAEWEYACRAGTTTAYYFGDMITPLDANYAESWIRIPLAVGSYMPNAFGLYDMHGNVLEWCEDWYEEDYPSGSVTDPKGAGTGKYRVLRGGSFDSIVSLARSSGRYCDIPTNRNYFNGLRLVKTS